MTYINRAQLMLTLVTLTALVAGGLAMPTSDASASTLPEPSYRDLAVEGGAVPAPIAESAVRDTWAHHYNLYSNLGQTARRTQSRNVVIDMALNGPLAISLNEVCGADYGFLAGETGYTYSFRSNVGGIEGCPGSNKNFGNAVLMHPSGSPVGILENTYVTPSDNCTSNGPGCWRALCLVRTYPAIGNYAGCTTHLRHNDDNDAYAQANEYLWFANSSLGSTTRKVLAGDFNLLPVQQGSPPKTLVANFVNAGYTNAFLSPTWKTFVGEPTTVPPVAQDPTEQLDYIFIDSRTASGNTPQAPHCPSNASDHCYTRARYGLIT